MKKFKSNQSESDLANKYPIDNGFDNFLKNNEIKLPEGMYEALKYLLVPLNERRYPNYIVGNGNVKQFAPGKRDKLIQNDKERRRKQKIIRIATATVLSAALAAGVFSGIAKITKNVLEDMAYIEWRQEQIINDGGKAIPGTYETEYIPRPGVDESKYSRQYYEENVVNKEQGKGL